MADVIEMLLTRQHDQYVVKIWPRKIDLVTRIIDRLNRLREDEKSYKTFAGNVRSKIWENEEQTEKSKIGLTL